MTGTESINYLREKEKEGNNQAIDLMDIICLYLPRILESPKTMTPAEVKRYNALIRAHVYEKEMLDNLIIK